MSEAQTRLFRKTDGTIKTLVLKVEFKVLRLPINQDKKMASNLKNSEANQNTK